ncbi:MAG TPA: hypothetical protein DE312_09190 [Gallionella sp.]|nr:MAG: hypothetical protein A2Z87_10025 [Gallionellales bacterium GWA2_54_124]OGT95860.1 MAG: hypothetical protein A2298_01625 [Gammaproteobacteria bacterium RIFOXYB2_FULL_38_6]HCI53469.1 hypothetical protein [Gallionella sp.]
MDKLLLAAFLSSLAGFITAIISIVKLVNEKEGKISESRQLWNDSVRKSFADLTSKLSAMTKNLDDQYRLISNITRLETDLGNLEGKDRDRLLTMIENHQASLHSVQADIQVKRHDLALSYAYTKLHFKPNDISFNRIEQKYDLIDSLIGMLFDESDQDKRIQLKTKSLAHIGELVEISRDILKTEWEIVKKGEPAYLLTKRLSFWGGVLMLFFLFSIGYHAYSLSVNSIPLKFNNGQQKDMGSLKVDNSQCWQLQSIAGKIFKLNSCTGDVVDVIQQKPENSLLNTIK